MKRVLLLILIAVLLLLLFLLWRRTPPPTVDDVTSTATCIQRAEERGQAWKAEGKSETEIARLFQTEVARCSGVEPACAAFVAGVNTDFAWLGRQVLTGSMAPADYLARVRDRSAKLRRARAIPELCGAYQRGDADGDFVPDDQDRCPATANLEPTGPDGCPDARPVPQAPSAEAVSKAVKALKVPVTRACEGAPIPVSSTIFRFGLSPGDESSFLVEVAPSTNQPAGCPVFYEIEARIRNSSFFSGTAGTETIRRVFRSADAVQGIANANQTLVFRLRQSDPIPWNALVRTAVEPNDRASKAFRVRAVNGNGLSAGWSAFRAREFRFNNRNFQ